MSEEKRKLSPEETIAQVLGDMGVESEVGVGRVVSRFFVVTTEAGYEAELEAMLARHNGEVDREMAKRWLVLAPQWEGKLGTCDCPEHENCGYEVSPASAIIAIGQSAVTQDAMARSGQLDNPMGAMGPLGMMLPMLMAMGPPPPELMEMLGMEPPEAEEPDPDVTPGGGTFDLGDHGIIDPFKDTNSEEEAS